jgi:hypothetical protein
MSASLQVLNLVTREYEAKPAADGLGMSMPRPCIARLDSIQMHAE